MCVRACAVDRDNLWARSSPLFPQHNPGCFLPSQFFAQLCRACPWPDALQFSVPARPAPVAAGLSPVGRAFRSPCGSAWSSHEADITVRTLLNTKVRLGRPPASRPAPPSPGLFQARGELWGVEGGLGHLRRPQGSRVGHSSPWQVNPPCPLAHQWVYLT